MSVQIQHDPSLEQPGDAPTELRMPIDTMPTSSFSSSNVHSALYDFGEQELYIRYLRDGADAIYQYTGLSASVWSGLTDAGSKGSYINANIAHSFPYTKLTVSSFPDAGRGLDNDLARRFVTTP